MKFNCYDSSVLMSLTKYIFIYMDPYRVTGSHIFPQKSLINDGNVPSVWNHSKEGWGCIVTNDSVLNSPLKLPTFHANQIHVSWIFGSSKMVLIFLNRISPVLTLRSWSIASVLKMIAPSGVFSVVAERYGVRINCGANRSLITLTITVASAVRSGVLWSLTWTWNCWRKRKMTQMIIFLSNHVFYEQCVSLPLKISK